MGELGCVQVLKVHKVATFVLEQLEQVGSKVDRIQLFCHDKLLPSDMNLVSVRAFVWKNGAEDMLLTYAREPAARP